MLLLKVFIITSVLCLNLFSNSIFKPLPKVEDYDELKVTLGKKLFFDPILSKDKTISCASCHSNYGADNKTFSLGVNNAIGNINTPSIFNSQFNMAMFWNGRAHGYKEQILGPITTKVEMDSSKELIEKRLNKIPIYIKLFESAYSNKPNLEDMIDAIAKFEKTLITENSKFDKYLRGEVSLSTEEKKGMELFTSYGCVSCHNGINIGGNSYQKFGTVIEYKESVELTWADRFSITKDKDDKNVFRVPSLRNVAKTAPYFHNGDIFSLKDAINIMAYYNLGVLLKNEEVNNIEAFLNTLTGEIPKTWNKDDEVIKY